MGLFDLLKGDKEISLTPQAGLLLAAISMVAIDGDIDDDEVAIIRRLDGGNRNTDDFNLALKTWKMKSVEECVQLVADAMNGEQQLVTMANLIDIAMADGVLAGSEQKLLEHYIKTFDVNPEQIEQIVKIIAIKNNKSIFE